VKKPGAIPGPQCLLSKQELDPQTPCRTEERRGIECRLTAWVTPQIKYKYNSLYFLGKGCCVVATQSESKGWPLQMSSDEGTSLSTQLENQVGCKCIGKKKEQRKITTNH
jgi:hypothetical protein